MGSKRKTIQSIADTVINTLLEKGIVVQRYNAYTSNSIYLKFDCGILNSLRISDHRSNKKLKYRYNITIGKGTQFTTVKTKEGFVRNYYNEKEIELFITHLLLAKEEKLLSHGSKERYRNDMIFRFNRFNRFKNDKGFWSQATFYSSKGRDIKYKEKRYN